jgi:hypothetical protein
MAKLCNLAFSINRFVLFSVKDSHTGDDATRLYLVLIWRKIFGFVIVVIQIAQFFSFLLKFRVAIERLFERNNP